MMPLQALLPVAEVQERLQAIFPEGTADRNYVTREVAAKTVFVMLYIGTVDGEGRWLRPDQVTRMSDASHLLPLGTDILAHQGACCPFFAVTSIRSSPLLSCLIGSRNKP